ncbi:SAM-dependent methyltransferase [Sphingopyxis witflariensis]|jgi:predicted RNA methylase|nr:SAM-dependent methyltransferase [Sphingopyxis witflariensis]
MSDEIEFCLEGVKMKNWMETNDVLLDQYYTRQHVAQKLYRSFRKFCNPERYQLVEPSAGTGSFFMLMPQGSLAFDVDPKFPGIVTADFLSVEIRSEREVAVVGNPPFGRSASMAVRFFNHAAWQASVIALILPRTFRKASIENRLDRNFHLIHEETVQRDAFLFRSKPYDVPAIFQIWERRDELRELQHVAIHHRDFSFTTPDRADFAIQRVGARAGRVHRDFTRSPSSHYFIRGEVEPIMKRLNFTRVALNVAGNPSLSKSEIVSLYRQLTGR